MRKTNHYAVAGFLLPFASAATAGLLVLASEGGWRSFRFLGPYLTFVPGVLLLGMCCSWKSLPLIRELDDKDYAWAGLVLNVLFLLGYSVSLAFLCLF